MQAAQRLTEANPEHAESRLLLARTALEAGLTGEARRHAEAARTTGLTNAACGCCWPRSRRRKPVIPRLAVGAARRPAPRRQCRSRPPVAMQCLPHRARVMASELSRLFRGRHPAVEHPANDHAPCNDCVPCNRVPCDDRAPCPGSAHGEPAALNRRSHLSAAAILSAAAVTRCRSALSRDPRSAA